MPFPARLIVILAAIQLSLTDIASARQAVGGLNVPDELVVPNHPATRLFMATAPSLVKYGYQNFGFHCNLMERNGQVGKVTLQSLTLVANNVFPPSVLQVRFSASEFKPTSANDFPPENLLIKTALAASSGDTERARAFVKSAERHDAECVRKSVAEARMTMDLASKGFGILPDTNGIPFVFRMTRPQNAGGLIQNQIRALQIADYEVGRLARNYDDVYKALEKRAARTQPVPEPRERIANQQPAQRQQLENPAVRPVQPAPSAQPAPAPRPPVASAPVQQAPVQQAPARPATPPVATAPSPTPAAPQPRDVSPQRAEAAPKVDTAPAVSRPQPRDEGIQLANFQVVELRDAQQELQAVLKKANEGCFLTERCR